MTTSFVLRWRVGGPSQKRVLAQLDKTRSQIRVHLGSNGFSSVRTPIRKLRSVFYEQRRRKTLSCRKPGYLFAELPPSAVVLCRLETRTWPRALARSKNWRS